MDAGGILTIKFLKIFYSNLERRKLLINQQNIQKEFEHLSDKAIDLIFNNVNFKI